MTGVCAPMGPETRIARCECGAERPSADRDDLFGFVDYGPGSREATERCVCGSYCVAHFPDATRVDPRTVIERGLCTGFQPKGPRQYDSFYCGCRGMG
jgi:hypothetical protein